MTPIKVLWIEDDIKFGPSIHFRVEQELLELGVELVEPELLTNGDHVSSTVRDWKPQLIMVDHNLEVVSTNGAILIREIRFQDHDTPIIFYSSEMGKDLIDLVKGEHEVYTSTRGDVHSELIRLAASKFAVDG